MRDVAARVGISQQAASLAFRNAPGVSEITRERVFHAAAELGYHPNTAAQILAQTRSHRIGVLFAMHQPYEVDLVEALYPAAQRHGYHLVLGALTTGRVQREAIDELLGSRVEAIILIAPTDDPEQLAELAARAARTLLTEGTLPTAVFAANDRCGAGLLHTLIRAGVSVPGQVSIIGCDDSRIAQLSFVDLTSIRQDAATMAELAITAAVERLNGNRTQAHEFVVNPTMVIRRSTAPRELAETR